MSLPIQRDNSGAMRKQRARWEQKRVKRPHLKIGRSFKSKFSWMYEPTPSKIANCRVLIDPDIDLAFYYDENDYATITQKIDAWCRDHQINVKHSFRKVGKSYESRLVFRFANSTDLIYFKVGF